jgi:membrane protease subunit HflC
MNNKMFILKFLPFVFLIVIGSSLFTVDQTSQAIVLQFGEFKKVHQTSGLKVKIPFIQEVIFYEKRILDYDLPPIHVTTQDQKRLVVDTYTRYKIYDPLLFFKTVKPANEVGARLRLEAVISSAVRNVLGRVALRNMLSSERSNIMRQIDEEVRSSSKPLGIEIVDVRIIKTELPVENRNAVFARMNSELDRFAKENRAKGEELAQSIKANADKEKTILLAEATKKSEITRGEGDAQAIKLSVDAYGKNPDFYKFYRTMESYEQILQSDTSLVLSTNNGLMEKLTNFLQKNEKNK